MDNLSTVNSHRSCIFSKLFFNGIVHSRTQSILMQTSKFSPPV